MNKSLKLTLGFVASMMFGFFIFAYISNNNHRLAVFGLIVGMLAYIILYLITMTINGEFREKFGEFYNPYEVYIPSIYGVVLGILYVFAVSSETMQFIFAVIVCMTILVSIRSSPILLKENPNEKIDELKMEILKNSGHNAFKSI